MKVLTTTRAMTVHDPAAPSAFLVSPLARWRTWRSLAARRRPIPTAGRCCSS